MLVKILSSNSVFNGKMYQIEDLMINTEFLMRPKAQKKNLISISHHQKVLSHERTSSHTVFIPHRVPEKIYTLTESPNATRAFVT